MIRVVFALLLLFALRPDLASASCALADTTEQSRYVRSDADFGHGAVRSGTGLELLAELTSRKLGRNSEESQPRPPRRFSSDLPTTPADLLATLSQRAVSQRESRAFSPQTPFVVYLPYHANPPPATL